MPVSYIVPLGISGSGRWADDDDYYDAARSELLMTNSNFLCNAKPLLRYSGIYVVCTLCSILRLAALAQLGLCYALP